MSDQQYQPGAVANGHRLTVQPDGSMVWVPVPPVTMMMGAPTDQQPTEHLNVAPSPQQQQQQFVYPPTQGDSEPGYMNHAPGAFPAPTAPKKSNKITKKQWIVVGAIAAVLTFFTIVGAIGSGMQDPEAKDTGGTTQAEAEEPAVVEPAPEPEPEMVTIPAGLVGMTANDAYNALAAVGLKAVYDGEATAKVLTVTPDGTDVEVGSTVTLTVEQPPVLTIGQTNAVSSAESYLSFTGFSRTGLIEQLEYEEFSTEDATFAVDYIAPDWNAEAAESAKSYLDMTSFSRQGLIEQLLYEGFTQAEAEFGVAANGY